MKILVTGGGGFAGRHLLRELAQRDGCELFATTLDDTYPTVLHDADLSAVCWVPMDVTAVESVETALEETRPDLVYHLAGQSSVGESIENPIATWAVNATGTQQLVVAMAAMSTPPARVVIVSSAEVYGSVERDFQPIVEDAEVRPVTPYGASKAAAELVSLQVGRASGIEVVVTRSFNHIGPGQDGRFVLPSIARQLTRIGRGKAEPIVRIGNLEVTRDFLDVRDAVRAYVRLMDTGEVGAAYNVCSGVGLSLLAVVTRLIEVSGTGARLEVDPRRLRSVDIDTLVGDPAKLASLGWVPRIGLDESLRDLLGEAETLE